MPTNPVLGEFVEKEGRLYFIKAEHLTAVHDKPPSPVIAGQCPEAWWPCLLGYGIAGVLMVLALCAVILFPMPLFALLIGMGVLNSSGVR
jgi:hypothetical protein